MISKNILKYYTSLKQKKYRQQEGKFLIEGYHLLEECLGSSFYLESVLVSESAGLEKNEKLLNKLEKRKIPVHYLKESMFAKLSDTEHSQGITAVVHKKLQNDLNLLYKSSLVIALDRITDPGNLGTIIRTAYWFGADAVLVSENSVEFYNSKVVRSTQGGLFHVDVFDNVPLGKTLDDLSSNGFNIYLLDINAEKNLENISVNKKSVFVFGNEAEGISKEILNKGFDKLKIKGFSNCESLNVAVSCAIVLHDYRRRIQR